MSRKSRADALALDPQITGDDHSMSKIEPSHAYGYVGPQNGAQDGGGSGVGDSSQQAHAQQARSAGVPGLSVVQGVPQNVHGGVQTVPTIPQQVQGLPQSQVVAANGGGGSASAAGNAASNNANAARIGKRRVRLGWTEEETRHLMEGCKRHGVGNWKKILTDPTLVFNCRTAVDLKDRFRTSFPEEYARLYPNARTHKVKRVSSAAERPGLVKVNRKERRAFSPDEDHRLLQGFMRHGPAWSKIQRDQSLGLSERRSTDLRDRFRNAFPDKYTAAGYKGRSKVLAAQTGPITAPPGSVSAPGSTGGSMQQMHQLSAAAQQQQAQPYGQTSVTAAPAATHHQTTAHHQAGGPMPMAVQSEMAVAQGSLPSGAGMGLDEDMQQHLQAQHPAMTARGYMPMQQAMMHQMQQMYGQQVYFTPQMGQMGAAAGQMNPQMTQMNPQLGQLGQMGQMGQMGQINPQMNPQINPQLSQYSMGQFGMGQMGQVNGNQIGMYRQGPQQN